MKNFIFYTPNGYTTDLNNKDIENMQILGFVEGENAEDAFKNLKNENTWLLNYDFDEIIAKEVCSKEFYFSFK